jgi:outer membrane protein insertion porin family
VFGFTEPYLFDNPISVGFNIYHRNMVYPFIFQQKSTGASFTLGTRIKGYLRGNISYNYEFVDASLPDTDGGSPYPINPYYMYGEGKYHVSSILPMIYRSTIDSPLTPSRGWSWMASFKYAGTFLGGEIHLIKPAFEVKGFLPLFKGHVLGARLEFQFVQRLRKTSDVPFWERFYLGGERSIRGYYIYSIGPKNEQGRNIGGEKSLVFNAEYIINLGGPVYGILFFDAGNAYGRDERIRLNNIYSSLGFELRVFVPALRVPFRLIFAFNSPKINPEDSNFVIRFAVGTTF